MWERPIQRDREKTDKHSKMKRKQNRDGDVRPGRVGGWKEREKGTETGAQKRQRESLRHLVLSAGAGGGWCLAAPGPS